MAIALITATLVARRPATDHRNHAPVDARARALANALFALARTAGRRALLISTIDGDDAPAWAITGETRHWRRFARIRAVILLF